MQAIYPGTFDPITNGHIDIINRAKSIFGSVKVLVLENPRKKTMFTTDERVRLIKESLDSEGIIVETYEGLLVNYLESEGNNVVIRGLRAVSDFEYEFQMALTNRKLSRNFEVLFLMTDMKYTYLSSSIVKEIAALKGDISCMVPECVEKALRDKN